MVRKIPCPCPRVIGSLVVLVPLIMLTRRESVMGEPANNHHTNAVAYLVAGIIIGLNLLLLYKLLGGKF